MPGYCVAELEQSLLDLATSCLAPAKGLGRFWGGRMPSYCRAELEQSLLDLRGFRPVMAEAGGCQAIALQSLS